MEKLKILESTLRDGSYTINYQYTAQDTQYIARILDEIGFEFIEIGPGIGLNAKSKSSIEPASTDEEYIKAARNAVKKAKIGMFFIPGIGRSEDLRIAAENGLDLIRCGTNITDSKDGFKYISQAKKLGMMATANLMKSYAVDAKEFGKIANKTYKAGADIIYLVDSAGGMFPETIKEYFSEAKNINPDIKLGFHGHDNLSLSMANTLAALDFGVEVVDSTIRGMGRSSGNTVTEKLVLILDRLGYEVPYDLDRLLELSEKIILPYLSSEFESSMDYILGHSQFHSSYLNSIQKVSKEYNIDPKHLVMEYSKIDKVNMDEDKLRSIAENMDKNSKKESIFNIKKQIKYKKNINNQIKSLKNQFVELKSKFDKHIFMNFTKNYEESSSTKVSPAIHYIQNITFGSAELSNTNQLERMIEEFKDVVDGYLIDNRIFSTNNEKNSLKKVVDYNFFYSDAILFAKSIYNYVKNILSNEGKLDTIFIDVYDEVYGNFKSLLSNLDIEIVDKIIEADIAILGKNFYSYKAINNCKNLKWIVLTVPSKIDSKISKDIEKVNLIRLDLEKEIFTEIIGHKHYDKLFKEKYGKKIKNNKKYCSGGYIGEKGTIVVDNINQINTIYGISNGDGSIEYDSSNK